MTLFIVSPYREQCHPLTWTDFDKTLQGLATTSYSSSIGSMTRQLGVSELAGQGGLTTFNGV
jgi:hypothetical protein